ncbi:MAG: dihydropyrimidinase [Anaerolineales bacterium]|nr:dihydropyrimidinase [Anaerolineales bacterium]MDW8161982.1 dihydropyrimidinase [Anaerolineales bacterium]
MAAVEADIVIRNGLLITSESTVEADLAIRGEQIVAIGKDLRAPQEWDVRGCYVLPGGVDVHVHPQMPYNGEYTSDDWFSASRAAACGGTTTIIDFVEPAPDQPLIQALEERLSLVEKQAYVDFSFHMTLISAVPECLEQIPQVVARGIPSFKLYTTYVGFGLSDEELLKAFAAVRESGGLVLVHAENDAIIRWSQNRLVERKQLSVQHYPLSRPMEAEAEAVQRVLHLAHIAQVPLYLVHLTHEASVRAVERARQLGWQVFAETCPQYLLLDDSVFSANHYGGGVGFVCAPPLRPKGEQAKLWNDLARGVIHSIGSDHCAFNLKTQKSRGEEDFRRCPPGLPGLEPRLSLIHTFGVGRNKISLSRWVEICCTQPARIMGLYPRKGTLEPGSDADVVIFDPNWMVRLTQREAQPGDYRLHEAVDYTPYEGWEIQGWPKMVFLRGHLVVMEGQPIVSEAWGKFLPRSPFVG